MRMTAPAMGGAFITAGNIDKVSFSGSGGGGGGDHRASGRSESSLRPAGPPCTPTPTHPVGRSSAPSTRADRSHARARNRHQPRHPLRELAARCRAGGEPVRERRGCCSGHAAADELGHVLDRERRCLDLRRDPGCRSMRLTVRRWAVHSSQQATSTPGDQSRRSGSERAHPRGCAPSSIRRRTPNRAPTTVVVPEVGALCGTGGLLAVDVHRAENLTVAVGPGVLGRVVVRDRELGVVVVDAHVVLRTRRGSRPATGCRPRRHPGSRRHP